ncbi:MAG: hypothetical protein H0V86_10555 [Chloroflexia bacterium]|nr:hypothetical protein [Chloroflexia bacterium]
MPPESQRAFDPTAYLTEHRGRKYLEVKWRLLWLRTEQPDAVIETEEVASGEDWVKFRSRVTLPDGGSATGHAYQTQQDMPTGWYEKGETKSLGRALVCLGYGTQFATEFDDDTGNIQNPVDDPIEFPRPRPVRASTPTRPEAPAPTRSRSGATWNDFWLAVREHKVSNPGFEESSVVGKDPSKRMTAEEAMRRFREATHV